MTRTDPRRVALGRVALGGRIRRLRERDNLGLAEVAAEAGISYSYLSDVERGRRLPRIDVLDAIGSVLGATVTSLLTGLYPWDVTEAPESLSPPPDGRKAPR